MTQHASQGMRASLVQRTVETAHARGIALTMPPVRDGRIDSESACALLEDADAALGNGFSYAVAQNIQIDDFDVVGFLVMTSRTLGESIERALQYQSLWSDVETYSTASSSERFSIHLSFEGTHRRAFEMLAEMAFYDLGKNAPMVLGRSLPLLGVRFAHSADVEHRTRSEKLFACPVHFEARSYSLEFHAEALTWPLTLANQALNLFFLRAAQEEFQEKAQAPASMSAQVTRYLEARLENSPSMKDVAAAFSISERTFQRKLREEGATYRNLLDALRRRRASDLLRATSLSIAEIAYVLGFSEQSAFHRAFRRWFDTSPQAFRTANHSPP